MGGAGVMLCVRASTTTGGVGEGRGYEKRPRKERKEFCRYHIAFICTQCSLPEALPWSGLHGPLFFFFFFFLGAGFVI